MEHEASGFCPCCGKSVRMYYGDCAFINNPFGVECSCGWRETSPLFYGKYITWTDTPKPPPPQPPEVKITPEVAAVVATYRTEKEVAVVFQRAIGTPDAAQRFIRTHFPEKGEGFSSWGIDMFARLVTSWDRERVLKALAGFYGVRVPEAPKVDYTDPLVANAVQVYANDPEALRRLVRRKLTETWTVRDFLHKHFPEKGIYDSEGWLSYESLVDVVMKLNHQRVVGALAAYHDAGVSYVVPAYQIEYFDGLWAYAQAKATQAR